MIQKCLISKITEVFPYVFQVFFIFQKDCILDWTDNEVFNEWDSFTQINQWNTIKDWCVYQSKYKILSTFMDEKTNRIRKINNSIENK